MVENPPDEARDGQPLPACCRQRTVKITPPQKVRKLQQVFYWGSETWERMFMRRTFVEGSNGGRKNVSTENVRRGHSQRVGLPWAMVVATLDAASYNLRLLRNWHDRSGMGDPTHPQLARGAAGRTWAYLDDADAARRVEAFEESSLQ